MTTNFAETTKKLGFGLMRLPKMPEDKAKIDVEQVKEMVDLFLEAGCTYFDTAYVYDNGASEAAAKEALIDRHDRESFTIATKLNAWLGRPDEAAAKKQLETSLERTGARYIDFYLLHALQLNNKTIYEDYGLWDFVREQKKKGLIKHWGFSFHATPEMLDELLTKYDDAEFVQLQINYADWENENIASRRCYEVARKHGKEIVVMEPVKGGMLATPPPKIQELFKKENPEASFASWAIRYVASMEGIITVLSGMSNLEQMKDNLSYMKEFQPLSAREQELIAEAQRIIAASDTVPCTACEYCKPGCPVNISIPGVIRAVNEWRIYQNKAQADRRYMFSTQGAGLARDCIACGQCEGACPQSLPIISLMQEAAGLFD
ncbi:MAG: aldo/keto reductase [Lachnospiraceae bacterium]|nr:aldo/keto reductase [Lachnospiraceae bacterium]